MIYIFHIGLTSFCTQIITRDNTRQFSFFSHTA